MPVNPIVIDNREDQIALCPDGVEKHLLALPEEDIRSAPDASVFVIVTHDHALDFLLAREALQRGDAAYVGMIGSKTKRGRFSNWLRQECGPDAARMLEELVCPIGAGGVADKRPEIIAAMVAAEIIKTLEAQQLLLKPQRSCDDCLSSLGS